MSRWKPVLVVDNPAAAERDYVAVCVASLEEVGRTTSQLGSEAAGAATAEFEQRLSSMLRGDDQLIRIHEGKHCLLIRALRDRNHATLAGLKLERLFAEPFEFRSATIPLKVRAASPAAARPGATPNRFSGPPRPLASPRGAATRSTRSPTRTSSRTCCAAGN